MDLKGLKQIIAAKGIDAAQDEVFQVAKLYYAAGDYTSAHYWIKKLNGHTLSSKLLEEKLEKKLVIC